MTTDINDHNLRLDNNILKIQSHMQSSHSISYGMYLSRYDCIYQVTSSVQLWNAVYNNTACLVCTYMPWGWFLLQKPSWMLHSPNRSTTRTNLGLLSRLACKKTKQETKSYSCSFQIKQTTHTGHPHLQVPESLLKRGVYNSPCLSLAMLLPLFSVQCAPGYRINHDYQADFCKLGTPAQIKDTDTHACAHTHARTHTCMHTQAHTSILQL